MSANLRSFRILLVFLPVFALISCTVYPGLDESTSTPRAVIDAVSTAVLQQNGPYFRPTRLPGTIIDTPTFDPPHTLSLPADKPGTYIVQSGDTLKLIARQFGVSLQQLIQANQIDNPDLISAGKSLVIPVPTPLPAPPQFKIIPDSELVDGPVNKEFNLHQFLQSQAGYLKTYTETVDDQMMTGEAVLMRASVENSVNPRLLLAALEYQSSWVTNPNPSQDTLPYPMGYNNPFYKGLYHQLSWAANTLNRGYYLWKINALKGWNLQDGSFVLPPATINAGTAGVLALFAELYAYNDWIKTIGPQGFITVYQSLWGYPFDYAVEPLVPSTLIQPPLQLPFEEKAIWSFTGGPHDGWADGSAWAALDFAPPGEGKGCVQSNDWVTSVANARVVYAQFGVVVLDLDQDGYQQTGWSVLYLHIATRDRIPLGSMVHAGDRIGHPSCEGGVSNGDHVHIARRYNGEWISADSEVPFDLDGWISSGNGTQYNGYLKKGANVIEAWDSQKPENQISR
jgi:LasA protease